MTQLATDADRVRATIEPVGHFVAGRFRQSESGETFDTISPIDNQKLTTVASGGREDVEAAVRAARSAFDDGPWRHMSPSKRAAILRRIADFIEARATRIAELETLDTGLPITQAKGQAARAADNFRFFAAVIESLHTDSYQLEDRFHNYSLMKPAGVAALITPWNTPFMLETWKVAPCLAAGDTCVLKPAEWSPLSATQLAEAISDAGVPKGVFNVLHGFGETAGAGLVAHPAVDLISFTGETTTGQTIIRSGADTLKRFSMELGGKSPIVVFGDAAVERAVDASVFGIFSLNGERCTASSRLLVEAGLYDEFVQAVAVRADHIRTGDPFDSRTEVGPLIHPDHTKRVRDYIQLGVKEGGRLLTGGAGAEGNYVRPTVLGNVTPDMRVFQEEIFGPVLVATPFESEQDAIRLANEVKYGLAAYVWTKDGARGHRVAQAIDAGLAWINSQNVRDLRTPFGGMKSSGVGREGGDFSFEFFCELKTIHVALADHEIPRFGASG